MPAETPAHACPPPTHFMGVGLKMHAPASFSAGRTAPWAYYQLAFCVFCPLHHHHPAVAADRRVKHIFMVLRAAYLWADCPCEWGAHPAVSRRPGAPCLIIAAVPARFAPFAIAHSALTGRAARPRHPWRFPHHPRAWPGLNRPGQARRPPSYGNPVEGGQSEVPRGAAGLPERPSPTSGLLTWARRATHGPGADNFAALRCPRPGTRDAAY